MLDYSAITQELGGADLVNLYNEFSGKQQIKKFRDKDTAQKKTSAALYESEPSANDMSKVLSPTGKGVVEAHNKVADLVVVKAKKEPKEKGSTGNRNKGKFLYKQNHEKLRNGSRRKINFDKIEDGMTYDQYREKGGNASDLSIMIRDGVVLATDKAK